ncbi:MAG: TetR/AcrR family transcriptional regulator [Desulfobacterales bacterium]
MPYSRFNNLSASRQEEILRAAADEFAAYDFENASFNRIIDQAGISKGAMYYYFADKEDVYRTVLDVWFTELIENIQSRSNPHTSAAYWEEWHSIFQRTFRYFQQKPLAAAILWQSIRSRAAGKAHPVLVQFADRLRSWMDDLLKKGCQVGAVRTDLPEGLLLEATFSMLEGFDRWLAERWQNGFERSIDEIAEYVTDLLRRIAQS